jgi:hypothetical protein
MGDLWVLGNHRLLCGDATVLTDVERVLGGQLADMTWTDPPYNVDYANSPKDKLRGKHRPIMNDNLGGGFEAFLYEACVNILSVTKGACYICMSSSELHTLQRMLDDGAFASVSEIGDTENISKSYVSRILRLALLAPDIVEAILAGTTDQGLMLQRLEQPLPAFWEEQRGLLDRPRRQ